MIRTLFVEPVAILALAGVVLVGVPWLLYEDHPPEPGLTPYTPEQATGRATYVDLGCAYCHSQQPRDPSYAPDAERGWGRASTAGDYVYDSPHQLGTMRTGPDLFNIGARQPSVDWHLVHLFQPRAVVSWSIMPSYPFLFEVKDAAGPDDRVVTVPAPWGPATGVVVARPEALALAAYLAGLDHTYPARDLPLRSKAEPAAVGGAP
ncbi:MAG: cbb3-type cytochrome c oxidase subunit II [Pseudomonadota bacterium]|nr:cbb3-type cytochrome c oxidase subunit II [Pseudomonadota bacterium]